MTSVPDRAPAGADEYDRSEACSWWTSDTIGLGDENDTAGVVRVSEKRRARIFYCGQKKTHWRRQMG